MLSGTRTRLCTRGAAPASPPDKAAPRGRWETEPATRVTWLSTGDGQERLGEDAVARQSSTEADSRPAREGAWKGSETDPVTGGGPRRCRGKRRNQPLTPHTAGPSACGMSRCGEGRRLSVRPGGPRPPTAPAPPHPSLRKFLAPCRLPYGTLNSADGNVPRTVPGTRCPGTSGEWRRVAGRKECARAPDGPVCAGSAAGRGRHQASAAR